MHVWNMLLPVRTYARLLLLFFSLNGKKHRDADKIPSATLATAFREFLGEEIATPEVTKDAPVYYHPLLPGESFRVVVEHPLL